MWKADGSRVLDNEFAEFSTATHCATTTTGITDPQVFQESSIVAPYSPDGRAYEFNLSNSNPLCYSGERSELGEALPARGNQTVGSGGFSSSRYFLPGHGYWISFWLRLGSNWPLADRNWDNVAQFKALSGSSETYPIMLMQVFGGHLWWADANTNRYWNLGAVSAGTWMKLTVHFLVSSNPRVGYVEVFRGLTGGSAAQVMQRAYMATTATCLTGCSTYGLATGSDMPAAARVGIYRNSVISGSATDYIDGYTVASTRAAAEASAFG